MGRAGLCVAFSGRSPRTKVALLVVAAGVCQIIAGALLVDRLAVADTSVDLERDGGRVRPRTYYVRAGRLIGSEPAMRLSEDEPFVPATPDLGWHVPFDASRVDGFRPFRVQLRHRSWLGFDRTQWLRVNQEEPLSRARTLFSYEGLDWASLETKPDGTSELHFSETTDAIAKVSYTLDDGPETPLPEGVDRVPVARATVRVAVVLRLLDGRVLRKP
jgi:hypothetical protein